MRGLHLVKHLRGLAECICIEAAHDAFERIRSCIVSRALAGAARRWRRCRILPLLEKVLRFGIARPKLEALSKLGDGSAGFAAAFKAYGEVEVVIGRVGISGFCRD